MQRRQVRRERLARGEHDLGAERDDEQRVGVGVDEGLPDVLIQRVVEIAVAGEEEPCTVGRDGRIDLREGFAGRDPRVLVALSFILGSRPWAMRDFLQRTAERVTRQTE